MFFELTQFNLQNEVRLFLHATNDEELTATSTPHPPIRQPASVWVVLKFFMLHRYLPLETSSPWPQSALQSCGGHTNSFCSSAEIRRQWPGCPKNLSLRLTNCCSVNSASCKLVLSLLLHSINSFRTHFSLSTYPLKCEHGVSPGPV